MDLDRGLLSASLREPHGFSSLQRIRADMIQGDAIIAYRFICDYFMQYEKMPSYQLILQTTGIDLFQGVNIQEPSGFFIDKIKERFFWHKARDGVQNIVTLLETQSSISELKSSMSRLLFHDLYDDDARDTLPHSIFSNPKALLRDYENAKKHGITGIPAPWPTINRMTMGWQKEDFNLIVSRPGTGKCLGRGTPVLMHDGSIKMVEDIQSGDLLMGPDSKPRTVLSINRGQEMLYRITPVKGDPWVCNESHVLSLKISSSFSLKYKSGQIVNISVHDYLKQNRKFKHQAKLWRTGVEFQEKYLPVDPYLVGLWLGDGLRNEAVICNPDEEVIDWLHEYCEKNEYNISNENRHNNKCPVWRISNNWQGNPVAKFVRSYCMINGQRKIPKDYLINSKNKRLQVLAGIIDTDGYLSTGGYEVITKFDQLKDDIIFLARSLGFAAYASRKIGRYKDFEGLYWRVYISGDLSVVPVKIKRKKAPARLQKKNVLVTGFTVEPIGPGDYYGFSLDGDHLFLLGDFTVTHNTWMLLIMLFHAWERGYRVMFCSTEMSEIALKRRAMALVTKLPYGLIKAGRLSESEFEIYQDSLKNFEDDDRFLIVGNDTVLKRSLIEQNIIIKKPDLVGVDGYYMVEDDIEKYSTKDDQAKGIWKAGKRMAKRHNIPFIVTHQLNRKPQGQKPGTKPDLDRLSHSDAAGQYADYVFSIWQTEEMSNDKRLGLLPMKTRDSETKNPVEIRWDLRNGLWNEIEKETMTVETAEVSDFKIPSEPSADIPF